MTPDATTILETLETLHAFQRPPRKPRFNPFAKVNCRYGAPMGRHGHDAAMWDREGKLYARHCGGDGYYDRGGAYWGHSRVFAVWTKGGEFCAYVEANSRDGAIGVVEEASS